MKLKKILINRYLNRYLSDCLHNVWQIQVVAFNFFKLVFVVVPNYPCIIGIYVITCITIIWNKVKSTYHLRACYTRWKKVAKQINFPDCFWSEIWTEICDSCPLILNLRIFRFRFSIYIFLIVRISR